MKYTECKQKDKNGSNAATVPMNNNGHTAKIGFQKGCVLLMTKNAGKKTGTVTLKKNSE